MGAARHVLVVEDNDGDAVLVEAALRDGTCVTEVERAVRLQDGIDLASTTPPDVVLLDLGLPDSSGLDTVRRAVIGLDAVPIVVLTGSDDEELAEHAIHLGAQDYLVKDRVDPEGLDRILRYAVERYRVTRALRETNEQLDEANRLKDDFIAIASHELRTPVTVISGALQTMVDRWYAMGHDDQQRVVLALRRQSDRLVALVEDLLVLSRIERGALAPSLEDVDVQEVVDQAIGASRAAASELEVRLPVVTIRCDREYLLRILVNLLDNAAKYGTDPVEVDVHDTPDELLVQVRDHGPGIDPSFRPRLFEQFARSDAPEVRREPGTGLGLAIVHALSEALGGHVDYEPPADGGAAFVVRLPHAATEVPGPADRPGRPTAVSASAEVSP